MEIVIKVTKDKNCLKNDFRYELAIKQNIYRPFIRRERHTTALAKNALRLSKTKSDITVKKEKKKTLNFFITTSNSCDPKLSLRLSICCSVPE